jgi:hypothetical protein
MSIMVASANPQIIRVREDLPVGPTVLLDDRKQLIDIIDHLRDSFQTVRYTFCAGTSH